MTRDLNAVRDWMRTGTDQVCRLAEDLPDDAFARPSALPGWTRAHVIGHLARNAEALGRLCAWAASGVETPMYSSLEQRDADIEASTRLAPSALRAQLTSTAAELEQALDGLDAAGWAAPVRSALGREISGIEVPWMRVREVWFHAVDLEAGVAIADFPPALVDALLTDVVTMVSNKPGCPAVQLRANDRDRVWQLGPEGGSIIEAPAADLLVWSSGRGPAPADHAPTLPAWL